MITVGALPAADNAAFLAICGCHTQERGSTSGLTAVCRLADGWRSTPPGVRAYSMDLRERVVAAVTSPEVV